MCYSLFQPLDDYDPNADAEQEAEREAEAAYWHEIESRIAREQVLEEETLDAES